MNSPKTFTVDITKGMSHGDKIIFREEGHAIPDADPVDVVVILVCEDNEKFSGKGNDLLHDFKISILEALSPSTVLTITHLDGRVLHIARPANFIVKPGAIMKVDEEGMPRKNNPFQKGDLYLRFNVVFPEFLPEDATEKLAEILSPFCPPIAIADAAMAEAAGDGEDQPWECTMRPVDIKGFGKKDARGATAYDEDDEEEGGEGNGVQCQQM